MSRIITTHLTVNATVEDVWGVLIDLTGYRRWNPFIPEAEGTVSVGERLDLTVRPPGGRSLRVRPWVTAVEEYRYVEWLRRLALPGILDGRHSFTLTRMAGGRTFLQQSESFTGVLVPVSASMLSRTRAGFLAMNEALAQRTAQARDHPTR
jgi:hypothetical protein